MNLRAVWHFIAGESRFAPLGVALAAVAALAMHAYALGPPALAGVVFVAIVCLGLIAGVFERVSTA